MDLKEKTKQLKRLKKLEEKFLAAESSLGKMANVIQPYFEQEIQVCMSTDGAIITDDTGEIGFVKNFLSDL